MFLGEKCIFFGENAWISENQEGFALENALNFRIYIKIAIELLLKLKSRIENACIIAARAPRSLQ